MGVGVVLGPGLNIKRSPLGGRNFEYLSEDPLVSGVLGAAYVQGLQSRGVGACLKHFACNSQEYKRFSNDANVDERTMRELYLPAFERVVRQARPAMVMSAYNKINGTFCSDNAWLLRDVLRDEWGFGGTVVTDWGGMHDRAAAYRAGCDLAMPGGSHHQQKAAVGAVRAGLLDAGLVTESAARVAALARREQKELAGVQPADLAACHATALVAAREGIVLLANKGALPLAARERVALVGRMAESPRYQGAGASHINCGHVAGLARLEPSWAYAAGYDERGNTSDALVAEAVEVARGADGAGVVGGLPETGESEGFDREGMALPAGMLRVIEAVCQAAPATVVALLGGSAVECPFADQVDAIVWAGLGGEACAEALRDVLTGACEPSGHLTETWPLRYADAPCSGYWGAAQADAPHRDAQYREGIYVGYRYYETAGVPVRFCFGHGLTYTSWEASELAVVGEGESSWDPTVTVTVTNTGSRPGAQVLQVYVEPPAAGPYRPRRILAGFARVELTPGESRQVEGALDPRAFRGWQDGWHQIGGTYGVAVGFSVRDLRIRGKLQVAGEDLPAPAWQKGTWYELPQGLPPQVDFERMLGRTVPERAEHKGTYTSENTLLELEKDSWVAHIMVGVMRKVILRMCGGDPEDPGYLMTIASSTDNALFGLANVSGGAMPVWLARLILRTANH